MKNIDSALHTTGRSKYIDDITPPAGCLIAKVLPSPVAHGRIRKLNTTEALNLCGVHQVITASDIPGENEIGGIIQDEPLLADGKIHFRGQPVAIVVADNQEIASQALELIELEVDELPAVVDPREAFAQGKLISPPRVMSCGDLDKAFLESEHVFEGRADTGGQEHLYLETQGAIATPQESGSIHLTSSTQGPTSVQTMTSRVLGIPMHKVEVDVVRLGGAFGGKEDQATPWAVMAALATHLTDRPVKLVLDRMEDMLMTGKRHPYSSDFKIGLNKELKIVAFEATLYQNAGSAADLSPGVLGRSLFHSANSYFIPNLKVTGISCKTNLPPFTAFRGFGGPQGMFVIEAAICKAAEALGVATTEIQKVNLLSDGDSFHYGMPVEHSTARRCWDTLWNEFDLGGTTERIRDFNKANKLYKKGFAVQPVCFGISFTNTMMNQASALVHIYKDGSVSVSTAAVEMGQGVNTKIAQVAAKIFSIEPQRVRVESTNTRRVANTSPTAASSGADLNGKATQLACESILDRLLEVAKQKLNYNSPKPLWLKDESIWIGDTKTDLNWTRLIQAAFFNRTNLSAQAQYATPKIHYDKTTESGRPFAYHVYGTAAIEVTLDILRGRYTVDSVQIVHDAGESLNPIVDLGQIEGALAQGIGWMTMEELIYDEQGVLKSNALSTYKVPDILAAPEKVETHFLEDSSNPLGIMNSKAVGEPPLMYGIGAYFALRNAIRETTEDSELSFQAPMTPERVLMALYSDFNHAD